MLKLGHIDYSNCYPVHAGILKGKVPCPFPIVRGIPTELNRLLSDGGIDVSPSSSIEYALNADRYVILPNLSITSKVKAMSILLESSVPIKDLTARRVALTTASATSVVLLRIILEIFEGLRVDYLQYQQGREDPYAKADAVLTIGDLALKRAASPSLPYSYDLGELWYRHTGLPFVFALWQVRYRKDLEPDLAKLYDILMESKDYGFSRLPELAKSASEEFGLGEETLLAYWNTFSYGFGESEQKGLLTYYGYSAELGVLGSVPELKIWQSGA